VNAVLDSIRAYVLRVEVFLGNVWPSTLMKNSNSRSFPDNKWFDDPRMSHRLKESNIQMQIYHLVNTSEHLILPRSVGRAKLSLTNSAFINNGYKIQCGIGIADTLIGQSVPSLLHPWA
jgi:hypothetical protein